jgi:hypothetical protein
VTSLEFNIKYVKYIANRFTGLEIESNIIINFLDRIFEEKLIKIKDFKFEQIKLKYGKCIFYSDIISENYIDLIEKTVDKLVEIEIFDDSKIMNEYSHE